MSHSLMSEADCVRVELHEARQALIKSESDLCNALENCTVMSATIDALLEYTGAGYSEHRDMTRDETGDWVRAEDFRTELDRLRAELAASQERVRELQSTCVERMLERDARIVELGEMLKEQASMEIALVLERQAALTRAETAERELGEMQARSAAHQRQRDEQQRRREEAESDLAEARKVIERLECIPLGGEGYGPSQAQLELVCQAVVELRALLAPPTTEGE